MATYRYNGVNIKMNFVDRFFAEWWFGRQIPQNYICRRTIQENIPFLFVYGGIGCLLMQIPFCISIGLGVLGAALFGAIVKYRVADPFSPIIISAACLYLHLNNVTFGMTIFSYHYEEYLYYLIYLSSAFSLLYRYYNFLAWRGVMIIHDRYEIPKASQIELRKKYTGYDYGAKKEKVFKTYTEACAFHENKSVETSSINNG